MSYRLDLAPAAINSAAGFLADDPDGLRDVLAAIDRLLEDPTPAEASTLGTTGLRRLRIGRYRVLYSVAADTVSVSLIGRTG